MEGKNGRLPVPLVTVQQAMVFCFDMGTQEVAEIFGITPGAVQANIDAFGDTNRPIWKVMPEVYKEDARQIAGQMVLAYKRAQQARRESIQNN